MPKLSKVVPVTIEETAPTKAVPLPPRRETKGLGWERLVGRVGLLYAAVVAMFVGGPVAIGRHGVIRRRFDVPESVNLRVRGCDLRVRRARRRKLKVDLDAHKGSAVKKKDKIEIDMRERSGWCNAVLYVKDLTALKIESHREHGRPKEQRGLRKVDFDEGLALDGPVEITGSGVNVQGTLTQASSLDIELTKGTVAVEVGQVSSTKITTADGDVALTSENDVNLNFTSLNSDYCLGAKNVTLSTITSNATFGLGSLCSGTCQQQVNVTLTAPRGSVYATRLDNLYETVRGESLDTYALDEEATFYWKDTERWREMDGNADILQVFKFTGPGQDVGRLAHTSNPAYISMRPWLVDALSAGFLKPRQRFLYGRLKPAQCPFVDGWSDLSPTELSDELGQAVKVMKDLADIDPPEEIFLNSKKTSDSQSTVFTETDDGFAVDEYSLQHNSAGVLAVTFSLTLSSIAGLASFLLLRYLLKRWNNSLDQRNYEKKRFAQLHRQFESGDLSSVKFAEEDSAAENTIGAKTSSSLEEEQDHLEDTQGRFRDLFELLETWVLKKADARESSLKQFVKLATQKSQRKVPSVPLRTFREAYELWALKNDRQIESVEQAREIFDRVKYSIETIASASTDAFTRVRFKTAWEIEALKRAGESPRPLPGEHSIAAFVRIKCVVTGLDCDFILKQDLATKYLNFCETEKIASPLLMTKNVMQDECGLILRRLSVPTLVPRNAHSQPALDLDLVPTNVAVSSTGTTGFFIDVYSVLSSVMIFVLLPLIFAGLAARSESAETVLSNKRQRCDKSQTFLLRGDVCFESMAYGHQLLMVLTVFSWTMSLFQATLHQLLFDPSKRCLKPNIPGTIKTLHRMTGSFHVQLTLLTVSAYSAYFFLVVIWFALGAVLNPQKNTPLGAMAVVLLTFLAGAHGIYVKTSRKLKDGLKDIIRGRILTRASKIAKHVPNHASTSVTQANDAVSTRLRVLIRAQLGLNSTLDPAVLIKACGVSQGENLDAVAKSANVSYYSVCVAFAMEQSSPEKLAECAEHIAVEDAIQVPPKLAANLTLVSFDDTAVKYLFNAFCCANKFSDDCRGSINSSLIAVAVDIKKRPEAFIRAFGLTESPAYTCALAKLQGSDDLLVKSARECVRGHKFEPALKAWLRLKEAKLVLSTYEDEHSEYLQLAKSLKWGTALPDSVQAALPRFALARASGRKTLMMTLARPLAELVNWLGIFPGDLATRVSVEAMTGLLAVKYGTDVNVRSFARECGLDESVASSIAFVLSMSRRGDRGAAMFTLLTHLDLRTSTAFLADAAGKNPSGGQQKRGKADPTRVLGVLAIAQRSVTEQMASFVNGLVKDFIVLHLGGEEPGIATLLEKVAVVFSLVELVCSSDPSTTTRVLDSIGVPITAAVKAALFLALHPQEDPALDALRAGLSREKAVDDHPGLKLVAFPRNSLQNTRKADPDDDDDDDEEEEEDQDQSKAVQMATVIRSGSAETDAARVLESNVLDALDASTAVPMLLVKHILNHVFPARSMINSQAGLGALKSLLWLAHVRSLSASAFSAVVQDVSSLLHVDNQATKSLLQAARPASSSSGEKKKQDQPMQDLFQETADPETAEKSKLFASKWLKAQAISEEAVRSVSQFAKITGLPLFFLQLLALGGNVTKSPDLMASLCEFLRAEQWPKDLVEILKGFFLRDMSALSRLDSLVDFDSALVEAISLFGEHADLSIKLAKSPPACVKRDPHKAPFAALVAFSAHHVGPLPGVKIKGDSYAHEPTDDVSACVKPRDVLAKKCNLPSCLIGALNEAQSLASRSRDGLKSCLLQMLGEMYAPDGGSSFPGLPVTETQMRCLLSIATGTGDGLEEAASACKLDPRMVEGLVLVASARAVDKDLVSISKVLHNPGLGKLFAWTGLPRDQAAGLIALAKQDDEHPDAVSRALGLVHTIKGKPFPAFALKAMAVTAQSANSTHQPTYKKGYAKLLDCMGPVAQLFGIRDRRAAEVAACVIRLCQGDASPLKKLTRLNIGLRDAPFFCALTVLGSPAPCNFEHGADSEWEGSRHAHSAVRNLCSALGLKKQERLALAFVEAGRGLKRGLKILAPLLLDALQDVEQSQRLKRTASTASTAALSTAEDAERLSDKEALDDESRTAFALVLYLTHGPSVAVKSAGLAADSGVRKFLRKKTRRSSAGHRDFLSTVARLADFPAPGVCHFLLAVSTPESKSSIKDVLDEYLARFTSSVMSQSDLRHTAKLLLALANGDEAEILKVGYDSRFLRSLSFMVHEDTSPHVSSSLSDEEGRTLLPSHPVVFLTRFARRDPTCFDDARVLNADDDSGNKLLAERLYPDVDVLKAVFMIIAHDWRALNSSSELLRKLLRTMRITEVKAASALVGVSVRGALVKANRLVNSPRAEAMRASVLAAAGESTTTRRLGCERHELLDHMTCITSFLGGSNSVYASSFMAGCSEDRLFVADALAPLCMKLKLSPNLATNVVMVMQGDMDALVDVCCAAIKLKLSDAPPSQVLLAELNAFGAQQPQQHNHGSLFRKNVTFLDSLAETQRRFYRKMVACAESEEGQAVMVLLTLADGVRTVLSLVGVLAQTVANYALAIMASAIFAVDLTLRLSHSGLGALCRDKVLAFEASVVTVDLATYAVEFALSSGNFGNLLRLVRMLRLLRLGRTAANVAKASLTDTDPSRKQRSQDVVQRWIAARCFAGLAALADPDSETNPENLQVLAARLFCSSKEDQDAPTTESLIRAAQAVGRGDSGDFEQVMRAHCGRTEHLGHLETAVALWNRSMTPFMGGAESPCDELDAFISDKLQTARHGFAIAAGCACSMLTYVSERLAEAGNGRYPPFGPRLLLAIKRDNVLERDEHDTLKLKPAFAGPAKNLVAAMSGADFKKKRGDVSEDRLLLFIALFQTLPRQAFAEAYANVFPDTPRNLVAAVETTLTPFSENEDAARLIAHHVDERDPSLPPLFTFLSSSARNLRFPFEVLRNSVPASDVSHERDDLGLVSALLSQDDDASLEGRDLVDLVVPYIVEKAVPHSAVEAWRSSKHVLADFVRGVKAAREASTQETVAKSAEMLAKCLDCSARHVVGFLSLGRGWIHGVVELISDVSEASYEQAEALRSLFALALPMAGLYEESSSEEDTFIDVDPSSEQFPDRTLTERELFDVADENRTNSLVFDEYSYLMKLLGFDLTEAKTLRDFATDDVRGTRLVDFDDFRRGLDARVERVAAAILRASNLDEATLLRTCFLALLVLFLLFLFIYAGIQALASASTFGTVVNSILPIVAGAAADGFNLLKKLDLDDILDTLTHDIDIAVSAGLFGAAAGVLVTQAAAGANANARALEYHAILKQCG